jgi:hypothetical protein
VASTYAKVQRSLVRGTSSGSDDGELPPNRHDRLDQAKGVTVDDGLGGKFWLKVVGAILAFFIGGVLLFSLIGAAWARWGGLGAMLFFFGLLLLWAWIHDRRAVREYQDVVDRAG